MKPVQALRWSRHVGRRGKLIIAAYAQVDLYGARSGGSPQIVSNTNSSAWHLILLDVKTARLVHAHTSAPLVTYSTLLTALRFQDPPQCMRGVQTCRFHGA